MTDIYAARYTGMTREEQTCCLTGHRVIPPGEEKKIMVRTRNILLRLIREKNVRFFGVGGAVGFDMLAAEYLLNLKAHHEQQLRIISVLPYPDWRETEDWTDDLRRREDQILLASDKVVYVRPQYEKSVFLLRDRKLVEGSAYCVSYCNRPRTGTAYTVRYALDRGVKVYNASSFSLRSLVSCDPAPDRILPDSPSGGPV
jgi:uncharacterized phage-like protein YoqJ